MRDRYKKGAHTVLDLQYHFVWKTKYSYKILNGEIALRLRDLIKEICALQDMSIIKGNIRPDHVHVLVRSPSHLSPAKIAQYLKGRTAHKLMREFPKLRKRYSLCDLRRLWGQRILLRHSYVAVTKENSEKIYRRTE